MFFFSIRQIKIYILISFFSVIVSLYLFEGYLIFSENKYNYKKIIEDFKKITGKDYDERKKLEIYNELRNTGENYFVSIYPIAHLNDKINPIFPLSGISFSKTIHCNENGYYSIYDSDRFGFNNPDSEWDKEEIEYVLVGDSYTHGACVNRPYDIASVLRLLSSKSVLNLGFTGNGPLIEYATLKEYLRKGVKKVLWIYYAGNDLSDLNRELVNDKLNKYLSDKKFSQELILKQGLIDKINQDSLSKLIIDTQFQNLKKNYRLKYKILKFFQLDRTKEKIRIFFLNSDYKVENIDTFKNILILTKELIKENNSKLYFVYLPDLYRYRDKNYPTGEEDVIKSIVKNLNIPFINIHEEVFKEVKNELNLFPYSIRHHYTVEGYNLVAKEIFENVSKK